MVTPAGNNPKILLLCQLFYPELVSTGQTLTELAEELVELGVDVEVLCGPPTVLGRKKKVPRFIEHKGIRIRRVWGTRLPKLSLFGKLINQLTFAFSIFLHLLFHRPDRPILVVTNPPFLGVICAILKKLRICRAYIFLIFDVYPDMAVELGILRRNGFIHRIWNRLNRFQYRNADKVIVLGDRMREIVCAEDKLGPVRNGRLHTIHVWSDDRAILPKPRSASKLASKWRLADKFVVQYSGNMARYHDMETVADTILLLRDNPYIHFQFVGEGSKKQFLRDFASKHNLTNCSFETYVPRDRLGDSLAAASVGLVTLANGQTGLAVPSKMFGIMAAARPVLAVMPPDCEAAQMINTFGFGIVVANADAEGLAQAITTLTHDTETYKQMSQRADRTLRENYSLHLAAQKYRDVIASVQ